MQRISPVSSTIDSPLVCNAELDEEIRSLEDVLATDLCTGIPATNACIGGVEFTHGEGVSGVKGGIEGVTLGEGMPDMFKLNNFESKSQVSINLTS
jgi:hypothetical protein